MSSSSLSEETRTLLPHTSSSSSSSSQKEKQQKEGSYVGTILNLIKTCMGTGVLTLPFAAQQGGVLLHTLGILGIAGWNLVSVQRLCHCWEYLCVEDGSTRSSCSSMLGLVARKAMGKAGVWLVDTSMFLLLMGIIIAYQDAVFGFWQATDYSTGSDWGDALVTLLVLVPLSTVPHMGHLAKASAIGLTVLLLTLIVIAFYGDYTMATTSIHWFPQSGLEGLSKWFGCVVFGFGVVPLTYHYRTSMEEPHRMVEATFVALLGVASLYILVGLGLACGFHIQGDVLSALPLEGWLPKVVRLGMVIVILATAPLLIVPCAELLEGHLAAGASHVGVHTQLGIRVAICGAATLIAITVPGFVNVLSFVGCCCVAFVGFVIPPLLDVLVRWRVLSRSERVLDILLLIWGLVASIISSGYTLRQMMQQDR
ncbi:MAG: hypothetical protein AAGJ35_04360 [Myxococcota bacterium]